MDQLISYGGWAKPMYPTSNSEYGRGVLSSMMKRGGQGGGSPVTFDPAAPNYYFPQPISSTGGGQWQQPMGFTTTPAQGHAHAPNCPHFATGANTKYPTGNTSGMQYQIPGVGNTSDMVHTADHIEVLHGDAAQAYLAEQNAGAGGEDQGQQQSYYAGTDAGQQQGMTVSFQPTGDAGTVDAPQNEAANNAPAGNMRQNDAGDYVKVSGLPMHRNARWRQGSAQTLSSPHGIPSARSLRPTTSSPAFKLCGKCPNCKNLDPASIRTTSAHNVRQQVSTKPSSPGPQRFPPPSAFKSKPKVDASQGQQIVGGQPQGIAGGQGQGIAGGQGQGIAGGQRQGIAGGQRQGIAGGQRQGIAGGQRQGIAGGQRQGIAGGQPQGIAGGQRPRQAARPLPIQGQTFSVNMAQPRSAQQ